MKKVISLLKNKYFLTILGLAVWIIFFDKNDIGTQLSLKRDVSALVEEKNYYQKEINQITSDLRELNTNPITLEKFAREKYLMKRDNEDIFVIEEK